MIWQNLSQTLHSFAGEYGYRASNACTAEIAVTEALIVWSPTTKGTLVYDQLRSEVDVLYSLTDILPTGTLNQRGPSGG